MHIWDERLSYSSETNANSTNSTVKSTHYMPNLSRNRQIEDHQAVRTENLQRLQHHWRNDVQLLEKSQQYGDAFVEMLGEFETK